jgi:hypothetical protein
MISIAGASAVTGGIIRFTGHYWGWLFGGQLLSAIGAGLLQTVGSSYIAIHIRQPSVLTWILDVNTFGVRLIGYQILYGVGIGCAMQVRLYVRHFILHS